MNAVNPRKKELDDFLRNVQSLLGQLEKKKIDMDKVMKREDSSYKEEVEKV